MQMQFKDIATQSAMPVSICQHALAHRVRPKPHFRFKPNTETKTENWSQLIADTETYRNPKVLN